MGITAIRFFLFTVFVLVAILVSVKTSFASDQSIAELNSVSEHWQQPVSAIGFLQSHAVQELSSKTCSSCHTAISHDWQTSLHAQAMGPGVLGQLKNYLVSREVHSNNNQQELKQPKCLVCHAPLSEQGVDLLLIQGQGNELAKEAINCAACHVRNGDILSSTNDHTRYHQSSLQSKENKKTMNSTVFKQAEFCASCHQFSDTGRKLNGKLLQNTFVEWKSSVFAQQGIVCQNCHMPAGKHLWRGIHDKEMVLRGVTIDVDFKPANKDNLKNIKARLTITNTGVGHYFPTYVTPRVVLEVYQLDEQGIKIKESYQSGEILRAVSLDLENEFFDSRLAPGNSLVLDYKKPRAITAKAIIFKVSIEPDYFYTQFYQASLENSPYSVGAADLQKALTNSQQSPYILFERRYYL